MAEIVQGLFGVSPELFKQQQDLQFRSQALAEAQLDPRQGMVYDAANRGRQIGRAVGGLLGAEDPMLARQSAENSLLQEVQASLSPEDLSDPYKLSAAVYQAALQANMPELANNAFQNMQKAQIQAVAQAKDLRVKDTSPNTPNELYAQAVQVITDPLAPAELKQRAQKVIANLYPVVAASPLAGFVPQFDAQGVTSMTPVAGTPAAQEQEKLSAKNKRQIVSNLNKSNLVSTNISEALKLVSPKTTGAIGEATRMAPLSGGSDAAALASYVDTIKANIGFEQLNAMRQESPTGGALGNVAVKELDFLQASLGNLNPNLSADVLKKNLEAVQTHYTNFMTELQKEMDAKFPVGKETSATPQQAATSKIVTIDNVDYQQTSNGKWVKVIK
jgi:hypothetical protein